MKKIRILYCMETIASGGVEQRRLLLSKWFNKDKYELKIICTNAFGIIPDQLKKLGVELFTVGSFHHPFHVSKHFAVFKILKKYKPHIIHGATFEGNSIATIGGKLGNVPITILEETSDPQNRTQKANVLLRFFVFFSDCIVAISPNVENYLHEVAKIAKEKIKLINNGVSIPQKIRRSEIQKKKEDLGIKDDEIVIGFVGRLDDKHKRISDLISAFSSLKNNSLKLLIVGDGKDKESLVELLIEKNISEKVILVGYQGEPSIYFEMMNIFCVPSSREGFGLVAPEAMLHKLPVIATKVGGLQDIVVDHQTGFLIPPFSPEILAEKLNELINKPELCREFGDKGYQRALEHYTSDRYCQEVENLYKKLLMDKGILSETE